jgi:hypothetical protein
MNNNEDRAAEGVFWAALLAISMVLTVFFGALVLAVPPW